MPRMLVTGGAGFIGSHVTEALVERGHEVRVLDNLITGHRENLAAVANEVDFHEADLRDIDAVRNAARDVEVVFHIGALPSVPRSMKDPTTTFECGVVGTHNVLEAGRAHGVRRVVFASSSSVYGSNPQIPKVETMQTCPVSPYALSKLVGEQYMQLWHSALGLETVSLRFFNVFGPRQDPTSMYSGVLSRFITALLREEPPTVFGDGTQSRDFTYVANVVDGVLRAADAPAATGQIINLACGNRISLNQILEKLHEELAPVPAVYGDWCAGDVRHSQADNTRARELLGWMPTVSFEDGLRKTIDWYLARQPIERMA
ncbi:MAG: SDR family oxidoreductase [Candidatus Krumholzibacteriia bacterium]